MSIILNIDASTATLYVSISKNGVMIAEKTDTEQRNHASNIQPFVEAVLKQSDIDFNAINAVAVMNGPGSYTGLRIGLSAAKGYCFALNIPLICISNLAAIAASYYELHPTDTQDIQSIISPMKGELIVETYNATNTAIAPALHLTKNSLGLNKALLSVGDVNQETIESFGIKTFTNILHNYMIINRLSYNYFTYNIFIDAINATPNYLKNVYIN